MKLKKNQRLIFKYPKNIGSKILNYNIVLRNTGTLIYNDILNMNCNCSDSPFKHDVFNHVIMGNLDIVKEEDLRQLLGHGTKFREILILNFNKIKNNLKTNLETFCGSWLKSFKVRNRIKLKQWKDKVLEYIFNRIEYLTRGLYFPF